LVLAACSPTTPPTRSAPVPCALFPADNVWNTPIDGLPVDPRSATYLARIGLGAPVHADFGSGTYEGAPIGIPYNVVPRDAPKVDVTFDYASESDRGPYPIPAAPRIEGAPGATTGDRHLLMVEAGTCRLYELYAARQGADGRWRAGSGAIWDLASNALRPRGWTSADAAGLPILPGLARYDEVAAGEVRHALRFTAPATRDTFIWPARHQAGDADPALPPMGSRVRLKANVDANRFPPQARVLVRAMQRYGLILADNGSPWFVTGVPDDRWDNDALRTMRGITGADFEVVDASSLMVSPDSGAARR
jgi:hypothetical protein